MPRITHRLPTPLPAQFVPLPRAEWATSQEYPAAEITGGLRVRCGMRIAGQTSAGSSAFGLPMGTTGTSTRPRPVSSSEKSPLRAPNRRSSPGVSAPLSSADVAAL